jgi:hypothetical protein
MKNRGKYTKDDIFDQNWRLIRFGMSINTLPISAKLRENHLRYDSFFSPNDLDKIKLF